MDVLSQHEAFLRAIFDAPEDDTPRLVYADFLQENGDEDKAQFIRYECEYSRLHEDNPSRIDLRADINAIIRKHTAAQEIDPWPWKYAHWSGTRGFPEAFEPISLYGAHQDARELRWMVVNERPEWYGARSAKCMPPARLGLEQIEFYFALPFMQQVSAWDLGGQVREVGGGRAESDTFGLIDIVQEPAITTRGVEALSQHRGARRITVLDLRNNNLDNDAARALVKSPYLDNLKRLQLLDGNRLRGRVWQQVIERFGEDVVG